MSRPKLGAFIRKIDYLKAKESGSYDTDNGEEDPSNVLIDVERQCNFDEDFSIEELIDGYAAFREKVCIPKFPGRHSPSYRVAYSTACVLERLSSDFDDDEDKQMRIGKESVYTWLALFTAKPSSGQLDLMSKFTGDQFEKYVQACKDGELVTIIEKMKIKFSYDAANETDEEQTYSSFLNDHAKELFKALTEEQCTKPAIQETILNVRMFYLQQISKLSPDMGRYIGYLVRDMVSQFPDKKPYKNFTNVKAIRSHLKIIEESLCTFEGDVKSLQDEDLLEEIITAIRKGSILKELFPDLTNLIVKFAQRKTRLENDKRIYDVFRLRLFRDLEKDFQPDGAICDVCVSMVTSFLTNGNELDKDILTMIDEAMENCVIKCKNMKPDQVKALFQLFVMMLKTGRIEMAETVKRILDAKEFTKIFQWKDLVNETKQLLGVIGVMTTDQLEEDRGDYGTIIGKQCEIVKTVLEQSKKVKTLDQIQKELITFIFNCLEIAPEDKFKLASNSSGKKYLAFTFKDTEIVDDILDRIDRILKNDGFKWESYSSGTITNLFNALIESYNGNGANVTDSQNAKILSIFATCCEGDSLEDKLIDTTENEHHMTVFHMIYMLGGLTYISLHLQSRSLSRCVPIVKAILKWGKIAFEEDHENLMMLSFSALNMLSFNITPELADITPEVVDLFLSIDKVSDLSNTLRNLYPINPEPVHKKLEEILDMLPKLVQSDKHCVLSIVYEVSTKHPEQFTKQMIENLINHALGQEQGVQVLSFNIINMVSARCPQTVCSQFSNLQNDGKCHPFTLLFRIMAMVRIACHDKKLVGKTTEYIVKQLQSADQTTQQQLLWQATLLARSEHESMEAYKVDFEKLETNTSSPEIKESYRNVINALEGKSIEGVFEDIQQAQEDINVLDIKVGATMNTVISLGDKVIEHDQDLTKVQKDVDKIEERVDDVEVDLTDTKGKVEEIDKKTMTNAPKWSRDLTKLMNPKDKNDWRLLAKRLGYSNDDIRGWAQQNDPCMALLSEWYATHKTSEATYGLLTHLQEMNRQDGVAIVENAMKATEDVVEDEEFEYPSPPPIFLSYQWGVQDEVKLLKQHLNMAGYECWMDIGQMGGGDKLFNKIDSGIRAAKVVICCTTEKYAQSPNCNREVNLSVNLGKPIIPLLMEKMSWPPKGAMGPIFSEYLFVRFFQRSGEETDDQRYWPIPKFQELLMQLNFHAVPDQSLIQPAYANWWSPIVEDIKINKDKAKSDSSKKPDNKSGKEIEKVDASPVIFLSYQWGKQPQVKLLYERLVGLGYTVWMDIFQMGGGDSLYDKIDRGMRGCKVVVSCVTLKYSLSANCRREISLADAIKKPIIPLLFESIKWPPDGPMSMVFTELLYINVHRDQNIQDTWTGDKVEELKGKLRQFIPSDDAGPKQDQDFKPEVQTDSLKSKAPKSETSPQTKSAPNSESQSAKVQTKQQPTKPDREPDEQKEPRKNRDTKTESDQQTKSKSCAIL